MQIIHFKWWKFFKTLHACLLQYEHSHIFKHVAWTIFEEVIAPFDIEYFTYLLILKKKYIYKIAFWNLVVFTYCRLNLYTFQIANILSTHSYIANILSSHSSIANILRSHSNIANILSTHYNIANILSSHSSITNILSTRSNISNENFVVEYPLTWPRIYLSQGR